jgi:glutamyl-tRNA synthetase
MITRIAPSPTGQFHVGTARTAYFNWLAARSTGGKFILRIDDTDKTRNTTENVDTIFRSMEWLGLDYDEVHYQSKREERHRDMINQLLKEGKLMQGDEGELRLNMEYQQVYFVNDRLRKVVEVSEEEYFIHKNMVVARKDGSPLYNFASVVDDIDLGVTAVIRGADHLPNTHKQEAIKILIDEDKQFDYFHIGLITVGGKKISKRNPDHVAIASMDSYVTQGYTPEAFKNWLLRIGWSPKVDNKENSVIPQDKAVKMFMDEGSMRPNNANMDLTHLANYQKVYTRLLVNQ